MDFAIVIERKKQEFLAFEVYFLLILIPIQGKKGVRGLSQTQLSDLGLASYRNEKPSAESSQEGTV